VLKVNRNPLYEFWFSWYSARLFRRHFDKVRLFGLTAVMQTDKAVPIIFYCNHAAWWDGFWTHLITEKFFHQQLFLMMEDKQLRRYSFFTKLGAFSVNRTNPREGLESIAYAAQMLSQKSEKQNALWIFPQGVIEANDKRPIVFFNGTSHIVKKTLAQTGRVYIASCCTRYEFTNEQKPDLFISFNPPELVTQIPSTDALTSAMQTATEQHLDVLRSRVIARDFTGAVPLIEGRPSVNRLYDAVYYFLKGEKKS
jgi:chlorobactene lauroyltransferase